MIREGGNRTRPFEKERSGLTDELSFPVIPQNQLTGEPIILEGVIKGNRVRMILVDGGSLSEIMYEHCFKSLNVNIRSRLRRCRAPLFAIQRHNRKDRNETPQSGSREALWECKHLERVQGSWKEVQWRQREEKMSRIREQVILRTKSSSGQGPNSSLVPLEKTWGKENTEETFSEKTWRYSLGPDRKEQSQIRMAEDDEEKTGFHTEEGVYCFTHMPRALKNSADTLQRMMEKVLANQRGRNVEIYLEEIVIKSKNEQDLVQGVEEILRKLKRVNINIDPITSSFGVKEGRFLGHMVTKEGVRADLEKV
ncbi:hypothetical protein Tco_0993451 [Tanacetum coccineum]